MCRADGLCGKTGAFCMHGRLGSDISTRSQPGRWGPPSHEHRRLHHLRRDRARAAPAEKRQGAGHQQSATGPIWVLVGAHLGRSESMIATICAARTDTRMGTGTVLAAWPINPVCPRGEPDGCNRAMPCAYASTARSRSGFTPAQTSLLRSRCQLRTGSARVREAFLYLKPPLLRPWLDFRHRAWFHPQHPLMMRARRPARAPDAIGTGRCARYGHRRAAWRRTGSGTALRVRGVPARPRASATPGLNIGPADFIPQEC